MRLLYCENIDFTIWRYHLFDFYYLSLAGWCLLRHKRLLRSRRHRPRGPPVPLSTYVTNVAYYVRIPTYVGPSQSIASSSLACSDDDGTLDLVARSYRVSFRWIQPRGCRQRTKLGKSTGDLYHDFNLT